MKKAIVCSEVGASTSKLYQQTDLMSYNLLIVIYDEAVYSTSLIIMFSPCSSILFLLEFLNKQKQKQKQEEKKKKEEDWKQNYNGWKSYFESSAWPNNMSKKKMFKIN